MSPRQNKTPPISQKVCTKMVEKCSVNTSPIMALLLLLVSHTKIIEPSVTKLKQKLHNCYYLVLVLLIQQSRLKNKIEEYYAYSSLMKWWIVCYNFLADYYLCTCKSNIRWWPAMTYYYLTLIDIFFLDIFFSSYHNIHKSSSGLCFWASDLLNDRFY